MFGIIMLLYIAKLQCAEFLEKKLFNRNADKW